MSLTQVVQLNQKNAPNFGENQGVWEYRTIDNEFLCYVVRKQGEKGKRFVPYILKNGKWVKEGFAGIPKPFYNMHLLRIKPQKPILLVEGEKTAEAASLLFPQFNVLTWMNGAKAVKKLELDYLVGLTVYLFPDNDKPGYEAMEYIRDKLLYISNEVYFVDISVFDFLPDKWDLADMDEGWIDFEDIQLLVNQTKPCSIRKDVLDKYSFPDLSSKSNPLNTTDNIAHLLAYFNIKVRYNLMTNYPEFSAPNINFSTVNEADCYFTEIANLCVKNGVPKTDLDAHINLISERNRYHPAVDFILSKPWDGISRIDEFMNTIDAENPVLTRKLIYRWMLGCVAAPFHDKGISLEGILVFQGKQNVGKTYWFLKLVPESHRHLVKAGLLLDPTNKDSVMNCTSCWIGELAEIDGTIRKSDIAAQKAFITQSIDYYRIPFGRRTRSVPRRTSFYGSVNPSQYLVDDTGNRRYFSVTVNKINYHHTIDMQQVWAEFKTLFDSGESYRLIDEEKLLLNGENELFESMDPLEEAILNKYRWSEEERNNKLTSAQVLKDLNYDMTSANINSTNRKCAGILSKLTGKKARKSDGQRVYDLPREASIYNRA